MHERQDFFAFSTETPQDSERMEKSDAYWRGRRARAAGQAREIADDRMTPKTRAEWFAGWDEEEWQRREKLPPERKAAFLARLSELRRHIESL